LGQGEPTTLAIDCCLWSSPCKGWPSATAFGGFGLDKGLPIDTSRRHRIDGQEWSATHSKQRRPTVFVPVSPCGKARVDVVFIGMDQRAYSHVGRDERLDRGPLDVRQHGQRDLAAALNDPEDRRFFLLQRAASARGFQSVASPGAAFF